jgi:hypothetical protein
MKKLLLIITLTLPLLISQNSWASSLPDCKGSPLSDSKWTYSFEWDNCQGTYIYSDGEQYVGGWKDDKKNGQGIYTYPNGDKYVGEFKDSKRHGQGTYIYSDGEKYVGEYKDDKKNGQGIYTFLDFGEYVGEFKDDKLHGQGTLTWQNGTKQEGVYKDSIFLYENIVISKDNENLCLDFGFKRSTPEFNRCVEKNSEKD